MWPDIDDAVSGLGPAPARNGGQGRGIWPRGRARSVPPFDEVPNGRLDNPVTGYQISERISLYHDDPGTGYFACTIGARPRLRLTAYQFDGSYLSLAVALRTADLQKASPGSAVVAHIEGVSSRPITVFLRLNLRTVEASGALYETLISARDPLEARFDLVGAGLPLDALEAFWLDIIFAEPEMWEIDIDRLSVRVVGGGEADG